MAFSYFTTSPACALCHSNSPRATAMRDPAGEELGPFNLWQGSAMANASRDPFWWAQVSAEVAAAPGAQEQIEGECVRCHAPMLSEVARATASREGKMSDLKARTDPAAVGLDGVACTTCHQILPSNLRTPESFSGGFEIGTERKIFGPHRDPATAPMVNHVRYTPTYADHVRESALCATCHTLLRALPPEQGGGVFAEQTPYLEWRNSVYNNEHNSPAPEAAACQDCHMPTYDDQGAPLRTRIARSPPGGDFLIDPREPFGQHTFVGANTVLPQILKAERATLKPQATDEAFDLITDLARDRLASSALVQVRDLRVEGAQARFTVALTSFAGHKVPTGYPARRAWLKVEVLGEGDAPLFVSGAHDARGRILNAAGAPLDAEKAGAPFEPHHAVITSDAQVQIYEAVMGDAAGAPTVMLTQATGWLKDNRLLPKGYSPAHVDAPSTRPVGVEGDEDFVGGGDAVRYEVPVPAGARVTAVRATLLYQALGARYMRGLFLHDTPEVAAFRGMHDRAEVAPEVVTTHTLAAP
ncbi:MAG: hypothetical protein FJ138_11960 [Deltaproteobacteria bacterium]|nr:hypothetical protein [Deltaproteobacteria bacterium]